MKKHTPVQRIFSVLFALFFLAYGPAGTDISNADSSSETAVYRHLRTTHAAYTLVRGTGYEELLSLSFTRLTRPDTSRGSRQPKCFDSFFAGCCYRLVTAGILFLIYLLTFEQVTSCKRFIIKYIHDQDGHKNTTSFYC